MTPIVYINHAFVPEDKAMISVFDLSLGRGYGVSEYLRTYARRPFRLMEHLERFQASAKKVHLSLSQSLDELAAITHEAIQRAPFKEVGIKFLLTGGISADGYVSSEPSCLIALATPFTPYPDQVYQNGAALGIFKGQRHFPQAKTTDYLPALVALKKLKKDKVTDVLFIDQGGRILECGFANFFALKNNVLMTPAHDILPGITRKVVLELAQGEFSLDVRPLYEKEILSFDAAFITSSNKEIMPITQIGEHMIGEGKVSKSTRWIMEAFASQVAQECGNASFCNTSLSF